jgi:hypothetical protein
MATESRNERSLDINRNIFCLRFPLSMKDVQVANAASVSASLPENARLPPFGFVMGGNHEAS